MSDIPLPPDGARAVAGGPSPQGKDESARLADLHTRLIDTLAGYDKVIEKAEPEFVGVAEEFRRLHQGQVERIAAMLAALGQDTEHKGSLFGMVNRAAVEVRSWFDDIGHNVMDALVQGEQHVLEGFDEAIAASPSPERIAVLEQMRGELIQLLHRHAPGEA